MTGSRCTFSCCPTSAPISGCSAGFHCPHCSSSSGKLRHVAAIPHEAQSWTSDLPQNNPDLQQLNRSSYEFQKDQTCNWVSNFFATEKTSRLKPATMWRSIYSSRGRRACISFESGDSVGQLLPAFLREIFRFSFAPTSRPTCFMAFSQAGLEAEHLAMCHVAVSHHTIQSLSSHNSLVLRHGARIIRATLAESASQAPFSNSNSKRQEVF